MKTSYIWKAGEALNQFLNVTLLNGDVGETISYHTASSASQGKPWACVLCRWLALTVERNHCVKSLYGTPMSERAGLWAGLQLLAVFLGLTGVIWLPALLYR